MLVVGLTGGIASGKSTASYLISNHPAGIPIIDLDLLAREVVEPGQPALAALRSAFGPTVINEADGTLNRAELGRLAFASPEKTKVLNKITHGAIRRRMVWKLIGYWVRGYKVVVVDTPLLVEAGLWKFCGELVLVYCRRQDQLTRMLARDGQSKGLTEADAKQRLEALLTANPNHVPARNQLGELLWEAGFAREGREQYRLAHGVAPASLRSALGSRLLLRMSSIVYTHKLMTVPYAGYSALHTNPYCSLFSVWQQPVRLLH